MSADMDAAVEAAARVAKWVEFDRRNRPELSDDRVVGISYENYPITRADLAAITATLPILRESWEKELEDDIENARGQEGEVNFAEDNRAAGWEAALDRIELRFYRGAS